MEFCKISNIFQEQLGNSSKEIKRTSKIIVPAEKFIIYIKRYLYKVKKEGYKKYLSDNITKTYKKSTNSKVNRVDLDVKKVEDKLLKSDRVDQLQKHNAYIAVKDHKESFLLNVSFRLQSYPLKLDISKVSKTILERINKEITFFI